MLLYTAEEVLTSFAVLVVFGWVSLWLLSKYLKHLGK
jgi:hypothetical protein